MTRGTSPSTPGGDQRPDRLHEEAERIAMPDYDWIGEPIATIADALFELTSHYHDRRGVHAVHDH